MNSVVSKGDSEAKAVPADLATNVGSVPRKLLVGLVTFESDKTHLRDSLCSLLAALRVAEERHRIQSSITVVINDRDRGRISEVESVVAPFLSDRNCSVDIKTKSGHGNIGYAAGQNLALNGAAAEYCLVLNPDVEMDSEAITKCVDYLEQNETVSMIAPQGFDGHGIYARLAKRYPSLFVLLLRWLGVQPSGSGLGKRVGRYVFDDRLPANRPLSIYLASGCFMFCRGNAWKAVDGFDEEYFLYFEDYDLSIRIREFGEIVEHPEVRVVHHGGGTARFKPSRLVLFIRSAIRFFYKHEWRWF